MGHRSYFVFFLIFFVVKVFISYEYANHLFCSNPEIKSGRITAFTGDSFSYTGAMENYINTGDYYFEAGDKKVFAGRVPHYSIPYYLFRQVFNKGTSLDILILLQIILETISWFLISLLIYKFTGSRLFFFLSLLFACLSYYYTHNNITPITDGPSASLLVISFWYLYKYFSVSQRQRLHWLLFSFFLSLAIIMRPYFILIFLAVLAYMFIQSRYDFVLTVKKALLVPILVLIMLAPWMIRTYNRLGKIVFFQQDVYAGYDIGEELLLTRRMLKAIGEDGSTMWDKNTAAGYFTPGIYKQSQWQVPVEITADSVLFKHFMATRNLCIDSINDKIQAAEFKENYRVFIDRYKSQNAFKYYFLKYVLRIKNFLFHSGSYYYYYSASNGCNNVIHLGLKMLQSLSYYFALVAGLLGLILLAIRKEHTVIFLITTVILILFFPIVFGLTEWRYFLPFYFFHTIGLFYLLFITLKRLKLLR